MNLRRDCVSEPPRNDVIIFLLMSRPRLFVLINAIKHYISAEKLELECAQSNGQIVSFCMVIILSYYQECYCCTSSEVQHTFSVFVIFNCF